MFERNMGKIVGRDHGRKNAVKVNSGKTLNVTKRGVLFHNGMFSFDNGTSQDR